MTIEYDPRPGINSILGQKEAEIVRLRSLLETALTEHEGNHGRYADGFMPNHWTHHARRLFSTTTNEH